MDNIVFYLPYFFAVAALVTLIALSVIDFRTWILPDWLNLTLALLGVFFHISTDFTLLTPDSMVIGCLAGGGLLWIVRFFGNRHYGQDTLGLGDVKLMAAGGLWLGGEAIILAMTVGAFAGLLHGIAVALIRAIKTRTRPNLKRLMIPAGPGFCVGLLVLAIYQYGEYFTK